MPERKYLMVDTHGLKPEEILCALYTHARCQGMGMLRYRPGGLTLDEARSILTNASYVDYLGGRVLKVDLTKVDESLYDRDNGAGSAQHALDDYYTSTPQGRDTKYHTLA